MTESPRPVSDTELEVLKSLWRDGPGAVREIQDRLRNKERDWAYTTVQTLLHRLQVKGYIASEKRGRAFVFEAVVSREELIDQQLGELANRVCEGSPTPLMLTLVQGQRFTAEELREFRQVLDEMEQEVSAKPTSKGRNKRGR